ncbi:endopeptidase La [candidate division TA06 bacterium]|uniref:Lon protease n=1 Tax=candidate division TA06 bacterium TaxID=2250710 RepID=A0A660S9I9_UNCT6|nr:MAG: endopeptidase La [candidate division TA06 bacterium]
MNEYIKIPTLPVRELVVFPYIEIAIIVNDEKLTEIVDVAAKREDRLLFVVPQTNKGNDKLKLGKYGTLVRIEQLGKTENNGIKILVKGYSRAKLVNFREEDYFNSDIVVEQIKMNRGKYVEVLARELIKNFEQYAVKRGNISPEFVLDLSQTKKFDKLAYIVVSNLPLRADEKRKVLEIDNLKELLFELNNILLKELEYIELEQKIERSVKAQLSEGQKQYYLKEQLKAIQKELGDDGTGNDIEYLEDRIFKANMPEEAEEKALGELKKLSKMMPISPEAAVTRTYIEWLCDLPWASRTEDNLNIEHAKKILNKNHFGLEKVKERLLEYLAVMKLVKRIKGQIICFVGAPGVGKTSLGRSIAEALGRRFVRISLGGVHDEAEIRGHRKTYVGALPGKIIQQMKYAETRNPVFLLDEVDKIGKDFRGDPASALLEVLDPELNNTFMDHYLEVPYDLSDVLFIVTANTIHTIPPALLDRMEVIYLPGYMLYEKMNIAKYFLIPKEFKNNGITVKDLKIEDDALEKIVMEYTYEAGVRNLQREIAKICRKIAMKKVKNQKTGIVVTKSNLKKYIGAPKFIQTDIIKRRIGVATGLAWTENGGDILNIEVVLVPGQGNLILTGQLGDVMQESCKGALTYIRKNSKKYKINENFYKKNDIHIHVPEGAVPKDGPSAGITIASAILSALIKKPTRADIAMTGEITITGEVLPIGGLQEKIVAAQLRGIKEVIIPKKNKADFAELPKRTKSAIKVHYVSTLDEVLKLVF